MAIQAKVVASATTKGQGSKSRQIEYIWSCKFWIKKIQLGKGKANKHISQDEDKILRMILALTLTLTLTLVSPDFFNLQVQVTRDQWLPWHGTAYAVPQYPCSTRFFFLRQVTKKL